LNTLFTIAITWTNIHSHQFAYFGLGFVALCYIFWFRILISVVRNGSIIEKAMKADPEYPEYMRLKRKFSNFQ